MLGDSILFFFFLKPEMMSHVAGGREHSEQEVNEADPNLVFSAGPVTQSRTLHTERVEEL